MGECAKFELDWEINGVFMEVPEADRRIHRQNELYIRLCRHTLVLGVYAALYIEFNNIHNTIILSQ